MMIFCMVSGFYLEILKEDQSLSILVTSNRVLAEQEVKAWNIYHFLTSYSEKKKLIGVKFLQKIMGIM